MTYPTMDPSDSIEIAEDDVESLEDLGMSIRTSDEPDEDVAAVVVIAGADEDADVVEADKDDEEEDEGEEKETD